MIRFATALMATMMIGAATTAPAQAQGFGFFFGDGPSNFFQQRTCLTDHQIRDAIANKGYSNIYLNVPNARHIQVRATKGAWVYLLDFNYCSARIEGRQKLRPAG